MRWGVLLAVAAAATRADDGWLLARVQKHDERRGLQATLVATAGTQPAGRGTCVGVPRRAGEPAGIASADGKFCCSGECGMCGGAGCSARPGGAASCCPGWAAFESAAGVCALSRGVLPCVLQDLAEVECPSGFARSGELCVGIARASPKRSSSVKRMAADSVSVSPVGVVSAGTLQCGLIVE